MKTYSIRLFPNDEQIPQLYVLSTLRMDVWNTLIDIQQKYYENDKKIYGKFDLINLLPELKKTTKPEWNKLNSKAIQSVATEVFQSYQSFFVLIKKDKTAKPPQKIDDEFINIFHTIIFNQSGWLFKDNNIIKINQIPFIYKSNIDITDLDIKEIRVKYRNNKWLCDIVVNDTIEYDDFTTVQDNQILAIDLGVKTLGTGVDSNGNVIVIRNKAKKISKYYLKQIANIQTKMKRKAKGSKRYKVLKKALNKCYHNKNIKVKEALHIQSKELLNMNYHTIVIGDLSVKRLMSTNGINEKKKNVRKSFAKSNINMFLGFLAYKAYYHKTNIVKINEQYTTQTNSLTGKLFKDKVELKERTVKLTEDIEIDRDLNSAINIMERYFNNHLAAMTQPLDKSNVIHRFNLMNKPFPTGKPILL